MRDIIQGVAGQQGEPGRIDFENVAACKLSGGNVVGRELAIRGGVFTVLKHLLVVKFGHGTLLRMN
jgi:hypothetical protein